MNIRHGGFDTKLRQDRYHTNADSIRCRTTSVHRSMRIALSMVRARAKEEDWQRSVRKKSSTRRLQSDVEINCSLRMYMGINAMQSNIYISDLITPACFLQETC
jgi:hypothetical protein